MNVRFISSMVVMTGVGALAMTAGCLGDSPINMVGQDISVGLNSSVDGKNITFGDHVHIGRNVHLNCNDAYFENVQMDGQYNRWYEDAGATDMMFLKGSTFMAPTFT